MSDAAYPQKQTVQQSSDEAQETRLSVRSPFDTPIPANAVLSEIIGDYGPLPEYVRCGLLSCRTKNGKGFIVAFSVDGVSQVGAIGKDCGSIHFGVDWATQRGLYDQRRKKADLHARLTEFLPAADEITAEMTFTLPEMPLLREKHQLLLTKAPKFFRQCVEAIRSQNGTVRRQTPDHQIKLIRLQGQDFFLRETPLSEANNLRNDIQRVEQHIEANKMSPEQMALKAADIGNIRQRWSDVKQWIEAAKAALAPEHLTELIPEKGSLDATEVRLSMNRKWILVCLHDRYDRTETWEKLLQIRD